MAGNRPTLSPYAPRILTIEINPGRIREVIGPGGKVINKITQETGAKIDIEQDGRIHIASVDEQAARRAMQMIREIVRGGKVRGGRSRARRRGGGGGGPAAPPPPGWARAGRPRTGEQRSRRTARWRARSRPGPRWPGGWTGGRGGPPGPGPQ